MTTTTKLTVLGVEVPNVEAEKALFDAYREDVAEMGDVHLFASELRLTINLYEPTDLPVGLQGSLQPGQKLVLGSSERAVLSQPKQTLGNGLPVVDLFYNKVTERYEILENENGRFVRVGNAGDKENSLYNCIVKIKEPSVPVAGARLDTRVTFYKSHLAAMKNPSDSVVREMLKEDFLPGRKVEAELLGIPLKRKAFIKRLNKLVRHLREELDTVDPPQRDRSKYSSKFRDTRALLEYLEYDYERKIKDFTAEQLNEEYGRIQRARVQILSDGYKTPLDWQKKNVYNKKYIKGSEDYKAAALASILENDALDTNERFRLATGLITGLDPVKLKKAYMRIRVSTDMNRLEMDLKAKFYEVGGPTSPLRRLGGLTKYFSVGEGHKLQLPYLKSLLETGQHTSSARLAMKLGLMYRGAQITKLTQDQKDEIRKLVEDNASELAGLADVDKNGNLLDTTDQFLQAAYAKLRKDHHAVLDEMQGKLRHSETTRLITGVDINAIPSMKFKDGPAKTFIQVMYNAEKKELRQVGSSWIDTAPLKKKILKWIKDLSQEELMKFINAGEYKEASKPATAYQVVWSLINRHMSSGLEYGSWTKYYLRMAKARLDIGHEPEDMRPFYEVEALLKYKHSRGVLLRRKERKDTLAKVLNLLSASDGWDPRSKLVAIIRDHPDLKDRKKEKDCEKYKEDPTLWLDELLERAGVDLEGQEQVHALLYAGGTYNGDNATDSARNIDNYLSLKRKAHRKSFSFLVHGLSTENIATIIGKVKPGSLEHWLMRKDKKLLTSIREELRFQYYVPDDNGKLIVDPIKKKAMDTMWGGICQTLDLNKKWHVLDSSSSEEGDHIMPEPPSKDDLKAFKDEYKDEEKKKKLWAGKYSLTYSLAKEQSLFNMSDRKELLKVVYTGQLEGYRGEELMKMLDGIDPKIRESLTRTPLETWTNPEKAAHAQLQKFLITPKQEIAFKDFLDVAKGLVSNNYSVIDFAVNDISPEKSVTLWCSKSYKELKSWSETRLQKSMRLLGIEARTAGTPSEEAKELAEEIAVLDKKISKHEFKIDDELKSQLQGLTREGKAVEFERNLKQKIGETMLSEPGKFEDLRIPPFELSRKGTKLLAEADINYHGYLRTGVGYHRFSVSGLETYAQGSSFMRHLWKTAAAQPTGTAKEREKEEQELMATFKKAHEDFLGSLDKWKDKQDEYTKRIVNVVNQTLGVAVMVALTATGAGTIVAAALVPIKAALNSVVKGVVEKCLSREGDVLFTQNIIKDAMVSSIASIPGILASIDFGEVEGLKSIIKDTIGSAFVKSQISSISKAIVGGLGNIIVASGKGDFEMSSKAFKEKIMKELEAYRLTQPQIYKTVLTCLSGGLTKTVTDAIKADVAGMDIETLEKLDDKVRKHELSAKSAMHRLLYKTIYNKVMTNKGYDLLSKGATFAANVISPGDVKVDKNKLEDESKERAIANSLVEALAEKGLGVDESFDYQDAEKLIKQIARKMPGVELTQEEIRTLTADVEAKFTEKQEKLTEDEKKLTEADQKKLLLENDKAERLEKKMKPWVEELNSMKTSLETECDAIAAEAKEQAEEDAKALAEVVEAINDGNAVKDGIRQDGVAGEEDGVAGKEDGVAGKENGVAGKENGVAGKEKVSLEDSDKYIATHSLVTRLFGKNSKKRRAASKKKVEAELLRRQAKKKEKLARLANLAKA